MAGGPATISDVAWESIRSSSVQMALAALQSVVSGSVMVTEPFPVGFTSMVQPWLLPWVVRLALSMVAPSIVKAWSRIRA